MLLNKAAAVMASKPVKVIASLFKEASKIILKIKLHCLIGKISNEGVINALIVELGMIKNDSRGGKR